MLQSEVKEQEQFGNESGLAGGADDGRSVVRSGSLVTDRDQDPDEQTPAIVVDVLDEDVRADEHHIAALAKTVAEVNPEYPAGDRVIGIQFVDELGVASRTYHYPESRLRVITSEEAKALHSEESEPKPENGGVGE